MTPSRARAALLLASAAAVLLAGCSPALDWREVHTPAASGLFPCKPASHERRLEVAGATATMTLRTCTAEATTFALAEAEFAEPAAVAPGLAAMKAALAANLGASAPAAAASAAVPGATPNAETGRLRIEGRGPDGTPVVAEALFFARGRVACQATVAGARPAPEAVQTFFESLRGAAR